jgi:hypothetical protein
MRIEHSGPVDSPTSLERAYYSFVTEFAPRYWMASSVETPVDFMARRPDQRESIRVFDREVRVASLVDKVLHDYAFEVPGPEEVRA